MFWLLEGKEFYRELSVGARSSLTSKAGDRRIIENDGFKYCMEVRWVFKVEAGSEILEYHIYIYIYIYII